MTLISLDHLGIDDNQERKDNFQKDVKSSIEQKISSISWSMHQMRVLWNWEIIQKVPCYEKPDDVEAILKEKYFSTNPRIIKHKEDGNENSSI